MLSCVSSKIEANGLVGCVNGWIYREPPLNALAEHGPLFLCRCRRTADALSGDEVADIRAEQQPGDSLEENLVSSGCGTRTRKTDIKSVKIKRLQKTVLSHYALSQVDGSGFVFDVRNT